MRTTLLNSCLFQFKRLVGFSGAYTIPDGVTSIGFRAFLNCRSLTSVTIPASVTSIGLQAFYGCTALTSVTIPNSVTSVGDHAFFGCTALTSVTIPASVTSIGEQAFSFCSALTSINVHPDNMKYASVGGVLFNKKCTVLIHCPTGFSGVYNIPDSVTSISALAFHGCTSLASVTIPDGVTTIGDGAFHDCTSLASVTIPNGVTSIGESAFWDCSALTSITIPDSVTSIGDHAFWDCAALISVTIPDSVTSIGNWAFYKCSALKSVLFTGDAPTISKRSNVFNDTPFVSPDVFIYTPATIYYLPGTSGWGTTYDGRPAKPLLTYAQENGGVKITGMDTSFTGKFLHIPESLAGHPVTSIGGSAFRNRRSLAAVTIPASVTSIGNFAFSGCSALSSVTIPASVTSIGTSVFSGCTSLTTVTIPASVSNISAHIFDRCTSLTSVTIPSGVTSIGDFAFSYCSALTSVTIPASVHSIEGSAFFGCSSLASILFTGDAPTVFSNDADDIPVAFPRAFFNTRAKIYFRPGTSGWGAKPKEKMIFQSEDEFDAYVDKHPDETFCWMMGEDYEIVPGEAAPATKTAALEPAAKQEATPTEEGWKTSQAAKEPDTVPGATTAERVAAALEANPERAERARAEASGYAQVSSVEVNAARVKESDGPDGTPRYRLSRDIELGLVTPETSVAVSPAVVKIVFGKLWDKEFAGMVHNPTQLAERILSLPPEIAKNRINTADAIVTHLKANPAHRFHPGEGYVSMGPEIRESFQARWFKDH